MSWPQVILFVISIGLTIAAGYLLRPKQKRSHFDTSTPTLHTKGSFIPLLLGVQKIAPIIAKVWNRHTITVKSGGSSGFIGIGRVEAQKDTHYAESALHLLCISRGSTAILGILVNGKRIDDNFIAIYSPAHPAVTLGIASPTTSGSTITIRGLGGNSPGQFRIYWGEETQPIDSTLSTAMDINSRWPGVCYIVWDPGQLGPSPVWPEIEYVVENLPLSSVITSTPIASLQQGTDPDPETPNPFSIQWVEQSKFDRDIGALVRNTGWFGINSAIPGVFVKGMPFQVGVPIPNVLAIVGGAPTRNFRVWKEEWLGDPVQAPNGAFYNTKIFVQEVMFFEVSVNTLFVMVAFGWDFATLKNNVEFGIINIEVDTSVVPPIPFFRTNPSHLLASLLFDSWPHGRGLDTSLFDLASLESLALLTSLETYSPGVIVSQGEVLESVISSFMQDMGLFIVLDKNTGLYRFKAIRSSDPSITIPSKILGTPLPERVINIGTSQITKKIFIFEDRDNLFQESTVEDSSDNIQSQNDFQALETFPIRLATTPEAAVSIAKRRISEDIQNPILFTINVKGEGKSLQPGDVCIIPQSEESIRVIEDEHQMGEPGATLKGFISSYDSIDSLEELLAVLGPTFVPESDLFYSILEQPILLNREELSVFFLRIRKHKNIRGSTLYLSSDNVTYLPIHTEQSFFFGGILLDPISDADPYVIEDGPKIFIAGEISGADIDTVLDLSSKLDEWRTGKQVCIINEEVFFLRNISSIDSDTIQLHGLIRYRFGSGMKLWYGHPKLVQNNPRNHAANDLVYIGEFADLVPVSNPLLIWNTLQYYKSLPFTLTGTASLEDIDEIQVTLRNKFSMQYTVSGLRQTNRNNNYYKAGENITIKWGFFNPGGKKHVGAGELPAGEPLLTQEDIVGYFYAYWEGSSFGIFEQNNITSPETTITAAEISASGLAGDIKVIVLHYTDLSVLPDLPPIISIIIKEIV